MQLRSRIDRMTSTRHDIRGGYLVAGLVLVALGGCGILGGPTQRSSQRVVRPLAQLETFEGEIVILAELEPDAEGIEGYEQGLRDDDGRIWSFLQNEGGLALRGRDEYRGRRVQVRAWSFPQANYLDVYQSRVLKTSGLSSSEPPWDSDHLGDLESLAGVIVCIGCVLKELPSGGAHAQCNLFADHEHGLRLDDGTILSLMGDPEGRHGKGWDLRHNPLYLNKSTCVTGRRIPGTKLFVVEDVRLVPGSN